MPRACLLLALLAMLPASPALADVVMPDQAACRDKKAGDPCEPPHHGSCQAEQCCRRRHGGPPPRDGIPDPKNPLDCYDCLRCVPAAPDMPTAAPNTAPDMPTAAPDMPAEIAEKPRGGMCASAPWHSDAGAWSLFAGALLLTTLNRRRA